jgi:hypothetical protein
LPRQDRERLSGRARRARRDVAFDPFDLPAPHIFKVRDNRIHEIEALGFMMPYMSKNGWSDFAR